MKTKNTPAPFCRFGYIPALSSSARVLLIKAYYQKFQLIFCPNFLPVYFSQGLYRQAQSGSFEEQPEWRIVLLCRRSIVLTPIHESSQGGLCGWLLAKLLSR